MEVKSEIVKNLVEDLITSPKEKDTKKLFENFINGEQVRDEDVKELVDFLNFRNENPSLENYFEKLYYLAYLSEISKVIKSQENIEKLGDLFSYIEDISKGKEITYGAAFRKSILVLIEIIENNLNEISKEFSKKPKKVLKNHSIFEKLIRGKRMNTKKDAQENIKRIRSFVALEAGAPLHEKIMSTELKKAISKETNEIKIELEKTKDELLKTKAEKDLLDETLKKFNEKISTLGKTEKLDASNILDSGTLKLLALKENKQVLLETEKVMLSIADNKIEMAKKEKDERLRKELIDIWIKSKDSIAKLFANLKKGVIPEDAAITVRNFFNSSVDVFKSLTNIQKAIVIFALVFGNLLSIGLGAGGTLIIKEIIAAIKKGDKTKVNAFYGQTKSLKESKKIIDSINNKLDALQSKNDNI